ncbi:hypothetical protein [Sneathiella litorea]|uniref:Uncharacterized protein n=1 Tax=Sneathiella litorea TaxID=2606216 RepID=A0A6L8W7I7_9PROT|nr:hypothetical protein [Sneathiella litorea]MZR31028.1 hypothetical protein [Sneathiella litorea]
MPKELSEHERILELEKAVPAIWYNMESLGRQILSHPQPATAAFPISSLTTALAAPVLSQPLLWAPILGFEQTAALAGILTSQAEDLADDLDLEKDDLPTDANIPGGDGTNDKSTRRTQYGEIKGFGDSVKDLLGKARDAKAQAAGAAVAAKKFAAAKPHIKSAEASFKKAKKALRDLERKKREIDRTPPDVPTKAEVKAVRDLAKTAHKETFDDLDHVKLALDAIV